MQNTRCAQFPRAGKVALGAILCIAMVAALAIGLPAQAHAKSYTMPHVDIAVNIDDAGNVGFQEQRQFDFDGSFTCVWWTFGALPDNAYVQINGVSLQQGQGDAVAGQEAHAIEEVPFQTEWRSAGGPGGEAYSWDEVQGTLYVFFRATDENLIASIDYTVVNGVSAYDDVSEFYWRLITEGWAVDSDDVTATITLPVPEGDQVDPTENVRAWGHGPVNGSVHFNDDGTITYTAPSVSAGDFAEARVLFPREWLPNLSESSAALHAGQSRLDSALAEEEEWANQANTQRMMAWAFIGIWVLVCLGLLIWAVVVFFRWGKELRPKFTEKYWRDVPDKDLSPAMIGRLMQFGKEDASQFTATLMNLSCKGVVRIDKGSYVDRRGKQVEDYYLTLIPEAKEAAQLDSLETGAISFIFGKIARGENSLWLKSIELYGKNEPEMFMSQMNKWHGKLTAKMNVAKLLEEKSESLQGTMRFVSLGLVVAAIAWWLFFENALQFIPAIPTAIILWAIAHFMSRRTERGAEAAAKARALKNWLKDFTRLDERPPTDVKVWGQFMVYAFLFGIADQVVKDMRMSVPTFRDMDDATFYTAMPYYYWYSPGFHHGSAITAGIFNATVSNTISSAQAAISEAASSSGGGGGFSGGGGGGFGGGGGGGAR